MMVMVIVMVKVTMAYDAGQRWMWWIAINDENYNELLLRKNYTFGVLYQKKQQSTESEIFGNVGHCDKFDRFLALLGELTTNNRDDSLCFHVNKTYQDFHLKFYVSTLLPHSTTNSQQLARKSRIGKIVSMSAMQCRQHLRIISIRELLRLHRLPGRWDPVQPGNNNLSVPSCIRRDPASRGTR